MDFNNRDLKPHTPAASVPTSTSGGRKSSDKTKMSRIAFVAAVAALVVLLIALIVAAVASGNDKGQSKYVDSTKLQAIFLNTGQVYFGNVKTLNNKYLVLTNIYYLQTASTGGANSSADANSNVTLVKLGCELHEPFDQMVINADQITFWENLQDNGQVATAVSKFVKENPQGQKCADQSNSASSDSSDSVQSATPSTTPATTPKTNP